MDLLSDIGSADQLTSAREENKVLKAKVKELSDKVKVLTLDNATLKAEVDIYRKEAALPSFSKLALGQKADDEDMDTTPTLDFIASGNGTFPSDPAASLPNLHGPANPLCCALNASDNVLASGGADSFLSVTAWGSALAPTDNAAADTVSKAARVQCSAPVISVSFCETSDVIAAGCMDGSVMLVGFSLMGGQVKAWPLNIVDGEAIKYSKYVKALSWSQSASVLASSSADGTVLLSKIHLDDPMGDDDGDGTCMDAKIEKLKSFHFSGPVEAACFVNDGKTLCLYERDTTYLAYFDLADEYKLTKYSLNGDVTGGFDGHVSFAVMGLSLSPNGKYLCCATDSSRNIIVEVGTKNIVRDLFGHKNDCFSQPRIAWSSNGQYVFGNTQEDSSICVWDVASSTIVKKLEKHDGQIRDIFCSKKSDTLISASYDKNVTVWLNEM